MERSGGFPVWRAEWPDTHGRPHGRYRKFSPMGRLWLDMVMKESENKFGFLHVP